MANSTPAHLPFLDIRQHLILLSSHSYAAQKNNLFLAPSANFKDVPDWKRFS